MRLLALAMVAVLACGTTSYKTSKGVAKVGGGVVFNTLLIGALIAKTRDDVSASDAADVMVPVIALGGLLALAGIAGMIVNGVASNIGNDPARPPPMPSPPMPLQDEAERRERTALDLTDQARIAARRNDCPRVVYLAERVFELDPRTFETVFARDPDLVKCRPVPQRAPDPPRDIPIPPLNPTPP